jgi:hypothetical protein
MEWEQRATKPVTYVLHQLKPNSIYFFMVNGKPVKKIKSNLKAELVFYNKSATGRITIRPLI